MFAWIKTSILTNFAFGAAFGGLLLTFFLWLIDLKGRGLVYDYIPELFAIFTGLVGAGLALAAAFYNADIQTELDRKARERKLLAARAMLPSALSGTAEICAKAIRLSVQYSDIPQNERTPFASENAPELQLDPSYVSIFRDIVEFTEDDAVANRLSLMLREHQVAYARWLSLSPQNRSVTVESSNSQKERVGDWAYLYALNNSLFDYARGETNSVSKSIGTDELNNALFCAGLHTERSDYQGTMEMYARSHLRNSVD